MDPLNGEPFIKVAEVDEKGIQVYPFYDGIYFFNFLVGYAFVELSIPSQLGT